ncbi:EcoKI restriction-modification system protein HsdS [[Clostridium] sordellii]|uniref:restriction endonuclease subunit S n=1 Tax=Paraclostridium sordellii TaxID=1505 RepID=UPI0005DA77B8|nr:restriction endonuclease subunit S [Paeniclostridium sordellii]CEP90230.1 EcoKI restriction-modification system protein HsdS [[Clostridium] sordellii] [Paeniclostridium sordellii]
MKSIKDIAILNSGFQGKTSQGNNFRQIKLKDLTSYENIKYEELESFNSEKVNEKYLLKKNDIILKAKSGDNTAALINEEVENVVATSHFIVIRVKDENEIDPKYLAMYLNSEYAQNYFKSHREGTTIPIIKLKTLENLPVKKLDIEKQRDLAKIYGLLNEEKETMQKLIEIREKQFKVYLKNELEKWDRKND